MLMQSSKDDRKRGVLQEQDRATIKDWFANNPNSNLSHFKSSNNDDVTAFRFKDAAGNQQLFFETEIIVKRPQNELIVSKMQNIDTDEIMVVKQTSHHDEITKKENQSEQTILTKLERSPGGFEDIKNGKYYLAMDYAQGEPLDKLFETVKSEIIISPTAKPKNFTFEDKTACYIFPYAPPSNQLDVCYYDDPNDQQPTIKTLTQQQATDLLEEVRKIPEFKDTCSNIYIGNAGKDRVINPRSHQLLSTKLQTIMEIPVNMLQLNFNANELFNVNLLMVNAVKEIHDKNIVHGDLKLDQFIYDEKNNTMQLIDFGQAGTHNESVNVKEKFKGGMMEYKPAEITTGIRLVNNTKNNLYNDWKKGLFTKHPPTKTDSAAYLRFKDKFNAREKIRENKDSLNPIDILKNQSIKKYKKRDEEFLKKIKHYEEQHNTKTTIEITKKMDIYSLGLAIGQSLGLTERKNQHLHFGMKEPEYTKPDLADPSLQVCIIKSIDEAKKNNIYNLPENVLVDLVSMLHRMTDNTPANRPELSQVQALLNKCQLALDQNISNAAQPIVNPTNNVLPSAIETPPTPVLTVTTPDQPAPKENSVAGKVHKAFIGLHRDRSMAQQREGHPIATAQQQKITLPPLPKPSAPSTLDDLIKNSDKLPDLPELPKRKP